MKKKTRSGPISGFRNIGPVFGPLKPGKWIHERYVVLKCSLESSKEDPVQLNAPLTSQESWLTPDELDAEEDTAAFDVDVTSFSKLG